MVQKEKDRRRKKLYTVTGNGIALKYGTFWSLKHRNLVGSYNLFSSQEIIKPKPTQLTERDSTPFQ